jgi:hypothetical protein
VHADPDSWRVGLSLALMADLGPTQPLDDSTERSSITACLA